MTGNHRSSAQIRADLDHPVIDADGHWLELYPVFFEYIDEVAGPAMVDRFKTKYGHRFHGWYELSPAERLEKRWRRPAFWGTPTNTADRSAAILPGYFYDRLDEYGIDLALVFPTVGLTLGRDLSDPDLANVVVRAYNLMAVEAFADYRDRMIPAGVLSLANPTDAIEQLEHAHGLGLRMLVTGGTVVRPVEEDAQWQPDPAKRRVYVDALGLDSPYDYEPVWRKFVELGIPVTTHSGSMGWPDRSLVTNFVGNHLGHFAQSHHVFARSLFLGGVTQRHPDLNFAFLEGGVAWAVNLLSGLIGHWEKRNKTYMHKNLKPTNFDTEAFSALYEKYTRTNPRYAGKLADILAQNLDTLESDTSQQELTRRDLNSDDFAAVQIGGEEDIRRLFSDTSYFGCEADDPLTALAFDNRLNLKLKPLFGSDIAHFDVTDCSETVEEAWELVDDGLITERDFRDFTFANAVQLYKKMNPDFFKGTVVERAADAAFESAQARALP
ncbi:amidohydrolase family protein [Nocardia vaccinii]|uniref:amidohydrolase family protein n=1 Tax=Nocardia vaccinii TaxID=1822 RepID=UPI000B2CB834|nr:amidohydrolase family protein [Nocardia vaccinii]